MNFKGFLLVFGTVFLAELGDKTQIATMLFGANQEINKLLVFFAASAALVLSAAIGVAAGDVVARLIDPRRLQFAAGGVFFVIGIMTMYGASVGSN